MHEKSSQVKLTRAYIYNYKHIEPICACAQSRKSHSSKRILMRNVYFKNNYILIQKLGLLNEDQIIYYVKFYNRNPYVKNEHSVSNWTTNSEK